jgi:methyl-accepting chemotaxis protein
MNARVSMTWPDSIAAEPRSAGAILSRLSVAAAKIAAGERSVDLTDLAMDPSIRPLLDLINNAGAGDNAPDLEAVRAAVDHECHSIREVGGRLSSAVESAMMSACELVVHISESSESIGLVGKASNQLIALGNNVFAKADQTNAEARRAGATATEGAVAVDRLVEAMGTIDGMTGDIKKVTFQINLLAVNAQIEAALAGELGNGFAVVATAVKGLAERTAALSREIEQRLNTIRAHASQAQVSFHSIAAAIGSANACIVDLIDNQSTLHDAIDKQTKASAEAAGKMELVSNLVTGVQNTLSEIGVAYQTLDGSVGNMISAISDGDEDRQ